jgi:hypothetical protein
MSLRPFGDHKETKCCLELTECYALLIHALGQIYLPTRGFALVVGFVHLGVSEDFLDRQFGVFRVEVCQQLLPRLRRKAHHSADLFVESILQRIMLSETLIPNIFCVDFFAQGLFEALPQFA